MAIEKFVCPNCNGSGGVMYEGVRPVCCGYPDRWGGCCNNPIPEPYQEPMACGCDNGYVYEEVPDDEPTL